MLSYKRVKITQEFLYISPGIALDKTPSTSKKKFYIGCLISNILNPSSLMLTELQKSLTSIDPFKKVMARKDGKEGWWLLSLRTHLPMHLSPYALVLSLRLCTNRKNILFRHLSKIVHLSRHAVCHLSSSQYATRKLSYWLNTINASPLCGSHPCHQYWSE